MVGQNTNDLGFRELISDTTSKTLLISNNKLPLIKIKKEFCSVRDTMRRIRR